MRGISRHRRAAFGLLALLLAASGVTHAGQGKNKDKRKAAPDETLAFILEHTDALKVTADQLPKLELLQTTENRVMNDPAVKAIMQKINAAKREGKDREFNAQKEHLAEKINERTNGQFSSFKSMLDLILSPEQMKAFHDLRGGGAPAEKAAKAAADNPPLNGMGVNPFEL